MVRWKVSALKERNSIRIEGYAVISEDGMIAGADGTMPPALMREEDQNFYREALDRMDVVVHGRHSGEQHPNAPTRRRLIVTRRVIALTSDPANPNAILWNPYTMSFEEALGAFERSVKAVGILGGTNVFELFLDRYDVFYLTRIADVRLSGGRPVFRDVPAKAPEEILAGRGLVRGEDVLRAKDLAIARWERRR
jgi:dihydrofolate reductase